MKILVTGKIGSGKSTITERLRELLNYTYSDCVDWWVRDWWKTEPADRTPAQQQAFDLIGTTDPKEIREKIFVNEELRTQIEGLMRPEIRERLNGYMQLTHFVLEYPLLCQLEDSETARQADMIIFVSCTDRVQEARLKERGYTWEMIQGVREAQETTELYTLEQLTKGKSVATFNVETNTSLLVTDAVLGGLVNIIKNSDLVRHGKLDDLVSSPPPARIGVIGGSFDPITTGHQWMIEEAAKQVDLLYVVQAVNTAKKGLLAVDQRDILVYDAIKDMRNVIYKQCPENRSLASFASELGASVLFRGIRTATDLDYERGVGMVNRSINPKLSTAYLLSPPQHLTTSSSIVRQTLYLAEWETIIEPLVTPYALYLLGEIRKYG